MHLRALLLLGLAAVAQAADPPGHRVEITLERMERGAWKQVPPGIVLERDDRVRFRFRSNFDGYLYVMNQGTSGAYTLLFPREETGKENNVRSGAEYIIPATEAFFRVDGPPGHDIVYWMMTPTALGSAQPQKYVPLPPPPKPGPVPPTLLPRCDETLMRARGLCIDSSAGPRPVPPDAKLPENLSGVPGARSRELIIQKRQNQSVLSSQTPLDGPVIYEFRLAHK